MSKAIQSFSWLKFLFQRSAELVMSGSGKTVFVTGGGGYVASHSIIELLKDDFTVVAVDNFVNSIKGKFWENTAVALFISDSQIPSIIFKNRSSFAQ